MQNLTDALKAARQSIVDGDSLEEAVQDAATEYKLNPKLIERKLSEQHGVAVEQLVEVLRDRAKSEKPVKQMLEEARQRQQQENARIQQENMRFAAAMNDFFRQATRGLRV